MLRRLRPPALGLLAALAACATPLHLEEPYQAAPPLLPPGTPRIEPGDLLQLEYLREDAGVEVYRLGVGDALSIAVHRHPELDLDTTVYPDGTIRFARLGETPAAGRTPGELEAELRAGLARFYNEPEVTVFLRGANARTDRFLALLLRGAGGAVRQLQVNDDGQISAPGLPFQTVAGLTVADAGELLNESLNGQYPGLRVLLSLQHRAAAQFAVVGEVTRPGYYPLNGAGLSLVTALATAGWATEYGDLGRVLLLSNRGFGAAGAEPGEPAAERAFSLVSDQAGAPALQARLYDVDEALQHGAALEQVRVAAGDTVLVLRSGVGNSNRAVEHYIRRHLPVNVGVSYRIPNDST